MRVIILAAGRGTRLGKPTPKPLTAIADEKTILDFQVERLSSLFGIHSIIIVVGYKKEMIIDKVPQLMFVYNHLYSQTNTAKSLLTALEKVENDDLLWVNGDVYFEDGVLELLAQTDTSCCLVDRKKCGQEEIKYNLNEKGFIHNISKQVQDAKGECLGINLIRSKDLHLFKKELEKVDNQDYFEKALENLTTSRRLNLTPVDVGGFYCKEIDFEEDLKEVQDYFAKQKRGVVSQ